jgi:hypothetical protein
MARKTAASGKLKQSSRRSRSGSSAGGEESRSKKKGETRFLAIPLGAELGGMTEDDDFSAACFGPARVTEEEIL